MTENENRENQQGLSNQQIDVNAIQSSPNYLDDPIEVLEQWVKNTFPQEMHRHVMGHIKAARNEKKKD